MIARKSTIEFHGKKKLFSFAINGQKQEQNTSTAKLNLFSSVFLIYVHIQNPMFHFIVKYFKIKYFKLQLIKIIGISKKMYL